MPFTSRALFIKCIIRTHLQVIFYNTYVLDVQIRAGGLVYVRDGAISLFDQTKVLQDAQPIKVRI